MKNLLATCAVLCIVGTVAVFSVIALVGWTVVNNVENIQPPAQTKPIAPKVTRGPEATPDLPSETLPIATKPEVAKPSPNSAPPKKPEPKLGTINNPYPANQQANLKNLSYKIWSWKWSKNLSDNEFLNQRPDATFLFLNLSVINQSTTPKQIPPFQLIDENNAVYSASPQSWAVEDSIGLFDSLNPGVQKQGYVVFDVPQKHSYKLKVAGGFWGTEDAFIELGELSQSAVAQKETANNNALSAAQKEAEKQRKLDRRQAELDSQEEESKKAIRTWTSADGKFTVEARLSFVSGQTVNLIRTDGKELKIPIDKLDPTDVEFIKNRK